MTSINPALEAIKKERGGKCWNCFKPLTPKDEDHSFCNDCWNMLMQHTFVTTDSSPYAELFAALEGDECYQCGEEYDNKIHTKPTPPDLLDDWAPVQKHNS